MANGFLHAFLQHMKVVAGQNYQGMKITPAGFFKALVENNPRLQIVNGAGEAIDPLKLSTKAGHIREIKLKSLPRILESQVSEEDSCDNDVVFNYSEQEITAPKFAKLSFFLDWRFVERYEKAASDPTQIGNPSVGVLRELSDQLMHTINGVVQKVNTGLLSSVVWGTNIVTGNNAVKAININKDSSVFDLSSGILEILNDAQLNEFAGEPIFVANGLMNKFQIAKAKNAIALAQNGVNLAQLEGYKYYHDIKSTTEWGTDYVGVFAPGTVGFVDIDRYIAWKTGKHGNSWFAQVALPIETVAGGAPVMVNFNIQIKEVDCPQDIQTQYQDFTKSDRGYQVIITKAYGLWQMPGDTVQGTDRLNGVNGALRFQLSNDCDPCERTNSITN